MLRGLEKLPAIDWVKRINRCWIVHQGLRQQAESWIGHLEKEDPGRLERSCRVVRRMCEVRGEEEDPKPWFYAGLFSLATAAEARDYLLSHRLTAATVKELAKDPEVEEWESSVGRETRELLERLREAAQACIDQERGSDSDRQVENHRTRGDQAREV